MARDSARREAWTTQATDYVCVHGLIGLSLRPLAAALGTSDRMLLYHFGTKDDLVAAVLQETSERSIRFLVDLPASADLRAAVHDLWDAWRSSELEPCTRIYVEAAALGLLGREPYVRVVRESNARWMSAVVAHLDRSGVARPLAERAATIIDAAFLGFQLDTPLDLGTTARKRAVADLADAVAALA